MIDLARVAPPARPLGRRLRRPPSRRARLLIPSGIKGWIERLDRLEPPAGQVSGDVPRGVGAR